MGLTVILPNGELFECATDPKSLEAYGELAKLEHRSILSSDAGNPPIPVVDLATPALAPIVPPSAFVPTVGQQAAADAVGRLVKKSGPGGLVIKGYAGTGKTTMLKVLAKAYGVPLVVTPTGKAALRVGQASGLSACTVHKWLYHPSMDPKTGKLVFTPKRLEELRVPMTRLVLVDEASMVGREIWANLWRAAGAHDLKIVLIGDGFQLPPVEDAKHTTAFSVMDPVFCTTNKIGEDVCTFECVELTEVVRQAQGSPVIRASMALRESGGANALAELYRVDRDNLLQRCLDTRAAGGVIISHTNETRHRVNAGMRAGIDPDGTRGPQPGEPLLVMRNNYDVGDGCFNGEQLEFEGWEIPPAESQTVADRYNMVDGITPGVKIPAEAQIHYGVARVAGNRCVLAWEMLSNQIAPVGPWAVMVGAERWARHRRLVADGRVLPYLEANYGYCLTAHKSQGSEWPYALVILEPTVQLHREEGRRWAYTAVTRAKEAAAIFYGKP